MIELNLINIIRWLFCCLIFFQISCRPKKTEFVKWIPSAQDSLQERELLVTAFNKIEKAILLIHSGDIITRTGNDFTSQSLRSLNQRDKTYSHIGIASVENDSVFVYHALGGEWNPDEKIRRDYFPLFADPVNNNEIGIFHLNITETSSERIARQARVFYQQGISFDMKFDLQTDDKMYCAEFVYKTLNNALGEKIKIPLSHINQFKFVGVDDIFLLPYTKCIEKIKFRNG